MKLEKLNINKKSIYLTFENVVSLWHQYIEKIRSKGYATGITGDEDDIEVVRFLMERIRKNRDRWDVPKYIQNAIDKYGKDTKKYIKKDTTPKPNLISLRITDQVKSRLQEVADSQGIKLSALVGQILATSVAK
jgi:hypothetical protein